VGLTLSVWLVVCSQTRAQGAGLHVRMQGDGCPSAALLKQKLEPLLGDEAGRLTVSSAALERSDAPQASVSDLGARYRVESDGLDREVEDPLRDCVERARVAAVFLALNMKARPTQESNRAAQPLQLGAQWFATAAYATEIDRGSVGAGLGVWGGHASMRFALTAAILTMTRIALGASGDVRGSVELMRLPLHLTASYLFHAGPLALGPSLGLELDLLRIHGAGVDRPQTAWRIDPGVSAAADLHLQLAAAWSLALRLGVSALARAYDLSLDPTGPLGKTPRLWLSAGLGLEWRWR
jgi:hypothetical protein